MAVSINQSWLEHCQRPSTRLTNASPQPVAIKECKTWNINIHSDQRQISFTERSSNPRTLHQTAVTNKKKHHPRSLHTITSQQTMISQPTSTIPTVSSPPPSTSSTTSPRHPHPHEQRVVNVVVAVHIHVVLEDIVEQIVRVEVACAVSPTAVAVRLMVAGTVA
jgi:hypothetical protein